RFVARPALIAHQDWALFDLSGRRRVMHDVAVADEQVLVAVEIEVEEARSEADIVLSENGKAGCDAGIRELTPAPITIEAVELMLKIGDQYGKAAGAIVVRDINAHAPLGIAIAVIGQTGFGADLLKPAAAAIEIKQIAASVIGHKNVGLAVLIQVSNQDAKAL